MLSPRRAASALFLTAVGCLAQTAHPHPATAPAKPMHVEHGTYTVHMLLHAIGTEEYDVSQTGPSRELIALTTTNDRGMKRAVTTTLDFGMDDAPTRLEQSTISAGATTHSLTEVSGPKVTVTEDTQSRSFTRPMTSYVGFGSMPASLQMMMMRYWLRHHRPASLPMLRASTQALPVEIREVGHEAFNVHGSTVRLTRYTVSNLVYGREVLWMNDSYRLAAVMTFAGGLPQETILDEYISAFDELYQSGVRQEMLDLADLTRAVPSEASGDYAITGARLIDATGAAPVPNATVIVRAGRIAAVGPAASTPIPAGLRVIHAEGKSLLPGLWEMHIHYSGVEFGPALMAAGITTARDCGGEFSFLTAVRHAIDDQHQLGPRLLLAGLIDAGGPLAFGAVEANTPQQGLKAVDLYASAKFQQIKVYTQIQPDVLRAIAAEAHRRGLTVTGHVPAAVSTPEGIADGMDQINHLQFVTHALVPPGSKEPFTVADLNTETARNFIKLLADKQIVVDPTVAWGEMAGHPKSIDPTTFEPGLKAAPNVLTSKYLGMGAPGGDDADAKFRERMAANLAVIGALNAAHVPIVAGSDTNLPGYGLDGELEMYVKAGLTPIEAIQTATLNAAKAMHLESESGTIERGKRADLMLVDGNPLANISDLRRVVSVVKDGRMFSARALARSVGFVR